MCYGAKKFIDDELCTDGRVRIVKYPKPMMHKTQCVYITTNIANLRDSIPSLYVHWSTYTTDTTEYPIDDTTEFVVMSTDEITDSGVYFWYLAIGRWK
mgnify:CR=1 FL=1